MQFRVIKSKMSLNMEIRSRFCKLPKRQSFFLFGPRGTGKTQFLRRHMPDALSINLLLPGEFAQYSARPESLIPLIQGYKSPSKLAQVVIDEVQRVPGLLNVVHEILEQPIGKSIQFTYWLHTLR